MDVQRFIRSHAVESVASDDLPEPLCSRGYTLDQVREFVGYDQLERFMQYMELKAHPLCTGSDNCSEPHGDAFYPYDIRSFVERQW